MTTIETTDRRSIHTAEITDSELQATAPSIFAPSAMPGVSGKYTFLPTSRIVEAMRTEGWKPIEAKQTRPRLAARQGFQMHLVRFQRRDVVAELDEFAPEVVLLNSHDRSSGYQIHAGMFRFVCKNGLMVADSLIPAIHVRHTGQELHQIIAASFSILVQLPKLSDRVTEFRNITLSDAAAREFATRALALRYTDPTTAPIRAEQLLDIRRHEDAGRNLWNLTNCVSENLLRGGMKDSYRLNRAGKPFRAMRAIRGLDANVKINLGIWALAETFRQY